MNSLWFRLMALEYRMKSGAVRPTLAEAGVRPGMSVLDFGCGPGRYALPTAGLVGTGGTVYAVDIHPLAINMVERKAKKDRLTNVHTIRTDCPTGLPSTSIDLVLLYDALHDVEDKEAVLEELHRVLKEDGRIQFKDQSFTRERVLSLMKSGGFCVASETASQIAFKKC